MKYREEDIQKLLDTLKIEEVVGQVVDLKRSGANFKGLCPFHQDSSPSFMVSPQKNISKCFVCGNGGNPITFYMKYHDMDFASAVKELAEKYSVSIKSIGKNQSQKQEVYKKYYELMELAKEYFAERLFSNEGRSAFEYLSTRGFKADFIKENYIGFAPNSWDEIINYLSSKGYEVEDLVEVGLVKKGDKGYYSIFRNRIMFPIENVQGQTIAFGGRTLEDSKNVAKYLNSSETIIFHKGSNLYGIKDRGNLIRKKSYAMLMEGYMDVLKARSYGFDVAIASLGTAFTDEQAELLKRYSSNVIIAYDMDSAGRKAVEKTGLILKEKGFNIRVIEFEDAKDPDEYLSRFGKESFLERVKESKEIFDFLYSHYAKDFDLNDLMSKQNFINKFKEFFQNIESELEKSLYIDKLSKNIDIDINILKDILVINNKKVEKKQVIKRELDRFVGRSKKETKLTLIEEESLKLILANNNYLEFIKNKNIKSEFLKKVTDIYLELDEKTPTILIENEGFDEDEKMLLSDYVVATITFSQEETKKLYKEIFISWFRIEIAEKFKERKNLMKAFNLKKIKDDLSNNLSDMEYVKNLYKEFKSLD